MIALSILLNLCKAKEGESVALLTSRGMKAPTTSLGLTLLMN